MNNPNKTILSVTVALVLGAMAAPMSAVASDAGAFIGGMLTTKVLGNMKDRTQAEQQQAYYAQQDSQRQQQQPVQQAAPAPAKQTTQQRLNELDKLAAGGYITPAEYKKKKQAIIDSV